MRLPPEWLELIGLLNAHRVRYLVIGAHALAAHGRPRATQDLDLFIDRSRPNCQRLGKALAAFGYTGLARAWERFTTGDKMAALGREPLRIDLLNQITGVSFRAAWRGRMTLSIGDLLVPFLGRAELELNKRSTGRAKDALDLELLAEVGKRQPARLRKPKT